MVSLIKQVFITQREDSRKGDFKDITDKDRLSLDIEYTYNGIESIPKKAWTKYTKNKVTIAAFAALSIKNSTKERKKKKEFEDLKISEYLESNKKTSLSKVIFSIRSKTFDLKEYQPWHYENV